MPTLRDLQRLQGVHPQLVQAIVDILHRLPMFVVHGVRTAEEQHTLWLKGRPGGPPGSTIVTTKDGYTLRSNHQPRSDGRGWAVDCAWIGPDPFAASHDWSAYGTAVEAAGLIWGGRWVHLRDYPHAELPHTA